jgi:hypothetical protein
VLGSGEVVLATVGGLVLAVGESGVVEPAGGIVTEAGRVAFGLRDSTLKFSRFTSSIRSRLAAPSFIDWSFALTSAS